jgi:hypothetical protein
LRHSSNVSLSCHRGPWSSSKQPGTVFAYYPCEAAATGKLLRLDPNQVPVCPMAGRRSNGRNPKICKESDGLREDSVCLGDRFGSRSTLASSGEGAFLSTVFLSSLGDLARQFLRHSAQPWLRLVRHRSLPPDPSRAGRRQAYIWPSSEEDSSNRNCRADR